MRANIRDITCYLPECVVTNARLEREHPDWNVGLVGRRSGVHQRHVARPDETALDLATAACQELVSRHAELLEIVDALIFCTQSADHIMPPNSCILHQRLGLPERVMSLDVNLACSGFIYLLAQAHAMISSGLAKHILLVNADTYSKYIHPDDRSSRVLFGDGAAATWISPSANGQGVRDVLCCTAGEHYDKFIVPAGGCRQPKSELTSLETRDESGNLRTAENIKMAGRDILAFVNTKIPQHVRAFLQKNQLTPDNVDLFVFHQASAMVLDSLTRLLGLDERKVFRNLGQIGNTVSASIPIALRAAEQSGRLSRGDTVLMCGFGAGLSWGSVLLKY